MITKRRIRKERRQKVIIQAKKKLNEIITHTNDISENKWIEEDVRFAVKNSLCEFVEFIKENDYVASISQLNEFNQICDFCVDINNLCINDLNCFLGAIQKELDFYSNEEVKLKRN